MGVGTRGTRAWSLLGRLLPGQKRPISDLKWAFIREMEPGKRSMVRALCFHFRQ